MSVLQVLSGESGGLQTSFQPLDGFGKLSVFGVGGSKVVEIVRVFPRGQLAGFLGILHGLLPVTHRCVWTGRPEPGTKAVSEGIVRVMANCFGRVGDGS